MSVRKEFENTALPHFDFVLGASLQLTRNEDDAEDLAQETFLKAYRFFHHYTPGTNIKAWLYRIMKNTFINRYRSLKRKPTQVELVNDGEFLEESSVPSTPESEFSERIALNEIRLAFEILPSTYKKTLMLSIIEGYSYKEIARILHCPIGTVMSRIFRARQILQEKLHDKSEELITYEGEIFPLKIA